MTNIIIVELEAIQKGQAIIVVDNFNRGNEGDFIVASGKITLKVINLMISYGKGLLCVSLPRLRC